ncbi:MAG: MarR family transcriptional regulator [Candidatus Heimdallarchaeota archaeon]
MSEEKPPETPEVETPVEAAEYKKVKAEVSTLTDKVKAKEDELASKEEKINQLTEENKKVTDELNTLKAKENESKETAKDLEHRLSQRELEITRLEGSVEDLSIAKKKIEDLQKEYKKLEEEMRAFHKIAENEPRFVILKDLQEFGEMRLNQISMKAGVSPAQSKKWLEELERAGLVEIHGEGRDSNPLVSKKK